MLNTEQVLTRLHIDFTSRSRAVQQVRELIESAPNPLAAASSIFRELTPPNTEFAFVDANEARMTVAYLIQDAITLGEQYDPEGALLKAAQRIAIAKETRPWAFVKDVVSSTEAVSALSVELKANGKIKKGGKRILAAQLYETHKALDNKALLEIFMKELDMGIAGARTYLYSLRKSSL
jgi:hypothetical protein